MTPEPSSTSAAASDTADPRWGQGSWRAEVEALLEGRDVAEPAEARASAAAWAATAAAADAVVVRRASDVPTAATQVVLPATLLDVADPQRLLDEIADVLGSGGQLVAAVPWCTPVGDAQRSLHPGSLLGLLARRFAVEVLVAEGDVLGVRARVDEDPRRRDDAATRALLGVQPDVERRLTELSRLRVVEPALREADGLSLEAVVAADAQRAEAQKERDAVTLQRDEAQTTLRDLNQRHAEETRRLRVAVERLTAHRDAARVGASAANRRADVAEERLARVVGSRWWRIRDVLVDARSQPRTLSRAPGRLVRIVRGRR